MATIYQAIVTVHCESGRDDVLGALEKELGAGSFLFRAEEGPHEFTVTHELLAEDAAFAESQAEHVVTEALGRAGVAGDARVSGTEIRG